MTTVKVAACQLPEVRQDVGQALMWMETYLARVFQRRLGLLSRMLPSGVPLCDGPSAKDQGVRLKSMTFGALLTRLSRFRCMFVFGLIEKENGRLFNSAAVVHHGELLGCYRKTHLLEGESIFEPGTAYPIFEVRGLQFGINICYDTNFPEAAAAVAEQGGRLIVCPANNMMRLEAAERWKPLHNEIRAQRARETGCWLLSSDVTGARDNRISYGPTAVIDGSGQIRGQVPLLESGMVVAEIGVAT